MGREEDIRELRSAIKNYMSMLHLSERNIAEDLKINRSTLRAALNNEIEAVTGSQHNILGKVATHYTSKLKPKYAGGNHSRLVPVLGTIPAGNLSLSEEKLDVDEWIESSKHDPRTHFALRIRGNSMVPQIQDNDLVVLRRVEFAMGPKDEGPTPPEALARWSGRIVAVCVNDEVSIKRLEISKGNGNSYHIILRALNPDFPSRTIDAADTFRIQGELVRIVRDV